MTNNFALVLQWFFTTALKFLHLQIPGTNINFYGLLLFGLAMTLSIKFIKTVFQVGTDYFDSGNESNGVIKRHE